MTTVTEPAAPADSDTDGNGFRRRFREGQSLQILIVLLGMVAVFSALSPEAFFAVNNFRNIVVNVSILSVLGVGVTYVIITAGIDLSIGSVLVFSGVISSQVMTAAGGAGWPVVFLGLIAALLSGAAWGLVNGLLVAKANIPSLIVTLGTMGMALGAAQILTGGIDLRGAPYEMVEYIGFGRVFGQIPVLSIIAAVILIAAGLALRYTRYGRYTYAVGSNIEAARRAGIHVDRHLISIYLLCGVTAGMAGFLNLAFFQSTTIGGHSTTNLNAIAAVVIGGTSLFGGIGTIAGTAVGMFIPAVLRNGFIILGVQPFWQQVVVGAVLITAVWIDQERRRAAMSGGAGKAGPRFLRGRDKQDLQQDRENTT